MVITEILHIAVNFRIVIQLKTSMHTKIQSYFKKRLFLYCFNQNPLTKPKENKQSQKDIFETILR